MKYGARHRIATAAGCHRSSRYIATEKRMALVVAAVARIERTHLLLPRTFDVGLARTLDTLAATADPSTDQGAAILATINRTPKSLGAWVRRNRERVQQMLDAQRTNGPPP